MSFELVGIKLTAQDYSQYMTQVGNADKATSGFGSTSSNTFRQLPGLADIATGALHRVGAMAVEVFAQAGAAAVGFLKDSIGVAGDFESGMADVSIAIGDSLDGTSLKLETFRNDFIQIGKELPVSTSEVQQAFVELVKGGVDPAALHMGGLKESIQFATAADMDLTAAAELSARQLGIWTDAAASSEEQAAFLAKSHDVLVKTANAATVGVADLAKGMNIAGGQAKALNLDYQDFATGMALIAPAFNSTEEAGTSFKNLLARLQPTTKPAIGAMKALGLYTDETGSAFFDAQGKFVGVQKTAELLQVATKDLTDAQRAQLLQTIFGNDAMGAAVRLSMAGADGYQTLSDKIKGATGVQEAAAAKQAGFNTAMDNFKGSIEALQITIGTLLLPVLTKLFNNYLAPGVNLLTDLAGALSGDSAAFARLTPAVQGFASGVSTAFTIVQNAIAAVQKKFATFQEVIRLWDSGVVSHKTLLQSLGISPEIAGVIDQVIGKIGGFVQYLGDVKTKVETAFKFDGVFGAIDAVVGELAKVSPAFALIKGVAEEVFPTIQTLITTVFTDIATSMQTNGDTMLSTAQTTWGSISETVQSLIEPLADVVNAVLDEILKFWENNGEDILSFVDSTWEEINSIIQIAMELIQATIVPILNAVAKFIGEHSTEIQAVLSGAWTVIKSVIDITLTLIKGILKTALQIIQGDWEGAWETIKTTLDRIWKDIETIVNTITETIKTVLSGAWESIKSTADRLWGEIKTTISTKFDELVTGIKELPGKVAGVGAAIVQEIWDGLKGKWDEFIGDLQDKLEELRNMLPFSEPKDPSSPLRGLKKSGMAIADMIAEGMRSAGPLPIAGLVAPAASPMLAGMRGGVSSVTNNQQRTASITYNTAVAPPMSQSYAMAQALVGGF